MKKTICLMTLAAAIAVGGTNDAMSANFQERNKLLERSKNQGLGRSAVSLIQREEGPGASPVAEMLIERFSDSEAGVHTRGVDEGFSEDDGKSVYRSGDGDWFLQVWGDGTKARYRNYAILDAETSRAVPVDMRLPSEKLRQLGVRFIETSLADLVQLGQNEELVPAFTEYEVDSMMDVDTGIVEKSVRSSTVVFSRRVAGVEILGPGSKIAVMFANDGTPMGFDFDWPNYTLTQIVQGVLGIGEIYQRASALGHTSLKPDLVKLDSMECGYFDIGARVRGERQLVQPACVAKYTSEAVVDPDAKLRNPEDGSVVSADMNVIPIGAQVLPDVNWPESEALTKSRELPLGSTVTPALKERLESTAGGNAVQVPDNPPVAEENPVPGIEEEI